MRNRRIKILNDYKRILIEIKRVQLYYKLSNEVENKFPTIGKPKQKIKTLF